ncbi:MAG: hypothetical protein ABIU05_08140 [Nitrospirales bacterium]
MFQVKTLFYNTIFVIQVGQHWIHPAFVPNRRGEPAPDISPA